MRTRLATPEARVERLSELRAVLFDPRRRQDSGPPAVKRFVRDYGDDAKALRGLIELLIAAGLVKDAERIGADAQTRMGQSTPLLIGLAQVFAITNRPRHAHTAMQKAVELSPADSEAQCQYGKYCLSRGDVAGAISAFQAALGLQPDLYEAEAGLAQALQRWGRLSLAIPHYQRAARIRPQAADCLCALSVAQALTGDLEAALSNVHLARSANPEFEVAIGVEANILISLHRNEEALTLLSSSLSSKSPPAASVTAFARLAPEVGKMDDAISLCRRAIADPNSRDLERARVQFSLGALHETKGEHDLAFESYRLGNRLSGSIDYDVAAFAAFVDQMTESFDRKRLKKLKRGGSDSRLPIFIIGMPHAGVGLVEQVLAAHSQVFAAGDLPDIGQMLASIPGVVSHGAYPDCMSAATQAQIDKIATEHLERLRELGGENARVTDSMHGNFQHLGLIWQLFPGAQIVHCRRDPLDTCFGCYATMLPTGYAYARDLTHLGSFYRQYARLMDFWKTSLDLPIFEMQYEELVNDPEPRIRELLAYCGLSWDAACLESHESQRSQRFRSIEQVRRPIHRASVGRAAKFGPLLDPLRAALTESLARREPPPSPVPSDVGRGPRPRSGVRKAAG